jgi:hypothetical protein
MQTGTIFSGIGHAGLILWVLVGDWLFPARPPEEIIATQVSLMTSEEFAALQAATPTPAEEPAPTRPAPRPAPVVEPEPEPEPVPEPVPEPEPIPEPEPEPEPVPEPTPPPPSDAVQAEEEQAFESTSTEINPTPEAAEIVAPSPVEVEVEAETSDNPTPAVSEEPSDVVVEQETQTEETVAEDTGDVLATEANREQTEATGMTTSIRPRTRPAELPEDVEVAAAEPEPEPQPVDDAATDDAIAALLEEVAEPTAVDTAAETGGQDLPQGPPLTGGEMGDISSSIARKWNLGAASTDTMSTMIVVRVSFAVDGKPTGFELIESNGPTQTGIDKLYESARRAVNRAYADGGLPLPEGKYETWRVLDLVFDANGMRLR